MSRSCPVCDSDTVEVVLELSDMPAQDGVVHETREAALAAPRGDVALGACRRCGWIGNLAFDPDKVGFGAYSYSQHHSGQYRRHVEAVVADLVERYGLRGTTVVDIGCGEGFFLDRLCRAGDNRGIGIDPSLRVAEEVDRRRLTLIRDYWSERYARHRGALVACRHVVDELPDPRAFLTAVAGALAPGPDAVLYVEVPDATRTFEERLIWNLGYAKRSWFTPDGLEALLRRCGLDVVRTRSLFGGEYLGIEGRRADGSPDRAEEAPRPGDRADGALDALAGFGRHFQDEVRRWRARVGRMKADGRTLAVWGAGMRGINFLTRVGDEAVFPRIVDINPDRQGRYLPGCGYLVEAPEALLDPPPDGVLISNPNYEGEIRGQLAGMGIDCPVETL